MADNIFTANIIKSTVEPNKTCIDVIFPALLQKRGKVDSLKNICRRRDALNYIPKTWRVDNVLLFKAMENIVDRIQTYYGDKVPLKHPQHKHQYAYQKEKSTSQALQNITSKIMKSLETNEVAISCFLDTMSTFDNANFDYIGESALS